MKYFLIAFAIFLMAFTLTSTVMFSDVRGTSESDGILIQWSTSQENGIKDFAVEKASQINNKFFEIGTVTPTGGGSSYHYTDSQIYKTSSSSIFVYRVRADGNDGSTTYSDNISVPYDFSSSLSGVAKRTWGSIKAMFR